MTEPRIFPGRTRDHGALDGLVDDDHTQYILEDGTRPFSGTVQVANNLVDKAGAVYIGASNPNTGLSWSATGHAWLDTSSPIIGGPGTDLNIRKFLSTSGSSTTALSTDAVINVDATTQGVTVDLPAASGNSGKVYYVKKIDPSGNAVVIDGNGSETIDGATTQSITGQYDSILVVCDGTEWWII